MNNNEVYDGKKNKPLENAMDSNYIFIAERL